MAAPLMLSPSIARADGMYAQNFTAVLAGPTINNVGTAIAYHQLTWTVVGTASVCTVALDTSADGITWSAGGAITGQTCTSNGTSTVANVIANYVRINVTALTVTAGSRVNVVWYGYVNIPSAGGNVTGTFTAGNTWYASAAHTISPGTIVLDMAGIAGADLGAKMNNCITQLAGAGTCKGDNLTGSLTLSTAVTTAAAVTFTFSGCCFCRLCRLR